MSLDNAIERLRNALQMHNENRTTMQSLASSVGDFLRYAATLRQQAGRADGLTLPACLKDAEWVHAGMLRGDVAVPSIRNMVHLRGPVYNTEDGQLARIAELQEQVANLTAALAQNTQMDAQCRGPGWCEACSRAAGCCFQGERCDRRDCPCPKVLGAELRACVHAERARVPADELVGRAYRRWYAAAKGFRNVVADAAHDLIMEEAKRLAAAPSQRAEVK